MGYNRDRPSGFCRAMVRATVGLDAFALVRGVLGIILFRTIPSAANAFVTEGLTPLTALQAATLNPAKLFHAIDSLGTVAPGKLADLVLLDADPLADITNITMIQAVVANGRYFDRAALDQLLTEIQTQTSEKIQSERGLEPTP
jgi:adenine deaminase